MVVVSGTPSGLEVASIRIAAILRASEFAHRNV
jgi:hypothetical protein